MFHKWKLLSNSFNLCIRCFCLSYCHNSYFKRQTAFKDFLLKFIDFKKFVFMISGIKSSSGFEIKARNERRRWAKANLWNDVNLSFLSFPFPSWQGKVFREIVKLRKSSSPDFSDWQRLEISYFYLIVILDFIG